jgi:DHA1 family purine ribonucleoside efflux pump-like MFS transporter
LPHVTPDAASGLRALGSTLRSGVVLVGLIAIVLVYGGHFTGFTYIRPAAEEVWGIDAGGLAVLLVFGVANILGTALSGPLADRALRVAVLAFPVVLAVGMLVMVVTGGSTGGLFAAAALWGFGIGGTPTVVLTWGARTEPSRLEQVGGLIVTVVQIAIGLSAVLGGVPVDDVSASAPLLVGGITTIIGAVLLTGLLHRSTTRERPPDARP